MARTLLQEEVEIVMLKRMFSVFVLSLSVSAVFAQGTPNVTVQLRDGSRVEGRIEEMLPDGTLFLRVSQHDQRRIPLSNVALIDRVGGAAGLPDSELRAAAGSDHLLLLSDGGSVRGRLVAIRGGQGSAQENEARNYVFRVNDGSERVYPMAQVARVYTGSYPVAAITGNVSGLDQGVDAPGSIRVPANAGWVSTGRRVRRGEAIAFNTTGEVQLSDNPSDRARAAGTPRTAPNSPLPSVYAGGLIGRIGNGAPFGIGDQASVQMPGTGVLYLAVNDDERSDNTGAFVVTMSRVR
jgi:hypothetical protein